MKIAIRLQIEAGNGGPCDEEILSLDKPHDQLEKLGLSLAEARELLGLRPGAHRWRPGRGVRCRPSKLRRVRQTSLEQGGKPRFGSARHSATCR